MSDEVKPVSLMTDEEFHDFADQMRLVVAEESHLWDIPPGSRDMLGDDQWRIHGPWRWQDCAAAIKLWFEAGLVSFYRVWPEEVPLDSEAAREILDRPSAWVRAQDGSQVAVAETDRGSDLAWEAWLAILASAFGR